MVEIKFSLVNQNNMSENDFLFITPMHPPPPKKELISLLKQSPFCIIIPKKLKSNTLCKSNINLNYFHICFTGKKWGVIFPAFYIRHCNKQNEKLSSSKIFVELL